MVLNAIFQIKTHRNKKKSHIIVFVVPHCGPKLPKTAHVFRVITNAFRDGSQIIIFLTISTKRRTFCDESPLNKPNSVNKCIYQQKHSNHSNIPNKTIMKPTWKIIKQSWPKSKQTWTAKHGLQTKNNGNTSINVVSSTLKFGSHALRTTNDSTANANIKHNGMVDMNHLLTFSPPLSSTPFPITLKQKRIL